MKVAIVGKASSSRGFAPYDNPEWEIWMLHDMYRMNLRWTRFFEIHDLNLVRRTRPEDFEWLKSNQEKIYIRDPFPGFENANLFPWRELASKYGRYFTNTISWQIAFAMHLGATDIGLYGVDMAQDAVTNGEYQHQRPSCEYFIGLARGMGINVEVAQTCDLLKTHRLYAVEDTGDLEAKLDLRAADLAKKVEHFRQQSDQAAQHANYFQGALDNTNYIRSRFYVEKPSDELQSE